MNFFYEEFPTKITIDDTEIPIVTDFREYVRLLDMLKDDSLSSTEKAYCLSQYFLEEPSDFIKAMDALTNFVLMNTDADSKENTNENTGTKKEVYSFEYDFPFIFSAFLSEYSIDIQTIKYMHWWKFRMLFDGLSEKTEIKQRMMYRSIDLSTIKNKEERKRIQKIQEFIRLPDNRLTDYDIGDAFMW